VSKSRIRNMKERAMSDTKSTDYAKHMAKSTAGGSLKYHVSLRDGHEDYVLAQVKHQFHLDSYLSRGVPSWMQIMARMVMEERYIQA